MVNAKEAFPNLLKPIKIGGVMFRNRMFGAPVSSAEIEYDGQPSLENVMYFERKAMGGAAAILYGEADIDPAEFQPGRWPREVTRMNNYNYPRLAQSISRHGAVAVLELCFPGIHLHFYNRGDKNGSPAWGPVDMTQPDGKKILAVTDERADELIKGFAAAALAAKNAGFGMVCLHGAHGFGLQQFMSPTINTRTDKWGGNPEGRCRLPVMVIDEIKRVCGQDFPVEIRISGSEILEDGYGIDEGCRIAEQLDGHADIIHVSVGAINRFDPTSFSRTHVSMFYPQGVNVEYAAEIKKHVKKSLVATVGGLNDPYYMEDIIASGKADIVYMGRQIVADPDVPRKIRKGNIDEIRTCMRCLNCFAEGVSHGDLVCAINPEISREREVFRALPPAKTQKVLIVGGGIAGMQAALTASYYGHQVILCEKSGELGGRILCEKNVPFKSGLHKYIDLQKANIAKANIDVRLNTDVTPEYAEIEKPDVIIAALGSEPVTPKIPGIDGKNVYQGIEVFENPGLAKGKVVILGAGLVGTELSIYLKSEFGIDSDIVEMLPGISTGGNHTHGSAVNDMIKQHNIQMHFNTKALEITADGVKCAGPDGEVFYPADTVIHAVGMRPLQENAMVFSDYAEDFHAVGECRKAANILFATSTAYIAAKYLGRY